LAGTGSGENAPAFGSMQYRLRTTKKQVAALAFSISALENIRQESVI